MITGAARADAAILLIDANEGISEQSKRHGYFLKLLGIKQIVVAINKMDLVNFSVDIFNDIKINYSKFLEKIGLSAVEYIPVSAMNGDNVVNTSENIKSKTLLNCIENLAPEKEEKDIPLRFAVQDVYKFDLNRVIGGRIESGILNIGDELLFLPSNKTAKIKYIEKWPKKLQSAHKDDSVSLIFEEQIFIERGEIGTHINTPSLLSDEIEANIFWLGAKPFSVGKKYILKHTTQETEFEILRIDKIINSSTLEIIERAEKIINKNESAEIVIKTDKPICFDSYDYAPSTGRFVIIEDKNIFGGGIIFQKRYPDKRKQILGEIKSQNIFPVISKVTKEIRSQRYKHNGAVIWLTGLSGSGKSTITLELEKQLFSKGIHTYILDGDNIRRGLNADLGFSPDDRTENIRRIAETAKLFADAGIVVISAFISPYIFVREHARKICNESEIPFAEIYLKCPIEVCKERDPKKLYKKAINGEILNFTGISSPYEEPVSPELLIETDKQNLDLCVDTINNYIREII